MDLTGFQTYNLALKPPLLIIEGRRGLLACGHLDVETFNKTGEAAAIVKGVKTFEDLATASLSNVSQAGEQLGLRIGMAGAEALEIIR